MPASQVMWAAEHTGSFLGSPSLVRHKPFACVQQGLVMSDAS
jgi:hypothetical protein